MDTQELTVLVTGASGYIGQLTMMALAKESLKTLIGVDIRDQPEAFEDLPIRYEKMDVRDVGLQDLMLQEQVDVVVHLASIVTPSKKSDRDFEFSVDIMGTRNVLTGCLKAAVNKLIVTSSGAAYGYYEDNPSWLDEEDPIRGNPEFAYSDHKRMVEFLLADYRQEHPELLQLIFRPGTILGATVSNQITNLFEKPLIMGIKGSDSPFVFIWDQDVIACLVEGVLTEKTGIYNLAGDGALSMKEIAQILKKKYVSIPPNVLKVALSTLHPLGVTRYGPEQLKFLQYRPVLSNRRLKEEFGYTPLKTSREVFEYYWQHKSK